MEAMRVRRTAIQAPTTPAYPNLRGSTGTTPPTKWLLYVGLHFTTDQLKNLRSDFEQSGGSIRSLHLAAAATHSSASTRSSLGIDYHGTPLEPFYATFQAQRTQ
jgi:hypothetical protein